MKILCIKDLEGLKTVDRDGSLKRCFLCERLIFNEKLNMEYVNDYGFRHRDCNITDQSSPKC